MNLSKSSKVIILATVVVVLVSGIAGYLNGDKSAGPNRDWKKPVVERYIAFPGSKGPVVWIITETAKTGSDSVKHTLKIVDPVKKVTLVERPFGPVAAMKENTDYSKILGNDFLLINDSLFNAGEEEGMQVFDIYKGEKLMGNDYFENKYPGLKDGISKVSPALHKSEFVFETKKGDQLFYNPFKNELRNKEEVQKSTGSDTTTQVKICFSEGKECNLYIARVRSSFTDNGYISNQMLNGYQKNDIAYRKHIQKLQKINDKKYSHAQRLITEKDYFVCVYTSGSEKDIQPIVEKIDHKGNLIWQNQDTALKMFTINFNSSNLFLNYSRSNSDIVFYNSGAFHHSLGINLNTGKTIFVHVQKDN